MPDMDFIREKMRLCSDQKETERSRMKKELFRIWRKHRSDRKLNETHQVSEMVLCEVMEALYGEELGKELIRPGNGTEPLRRMEWIRE